MAVVRRFVLAVAITPSLAAGPLLHAQTTAPLNLHQWGAVTLFHGLPSDHVRAIAQTADGTLWFGTDGGLARYDGRRTQTVAVGAVHALARDASDALWVGMETGAGRVVDGAFQLVVGTEDLSVTAIAPSPSGVVTLASAGGVLVRCRPGARPADAP